MKVLYGICGEGRGHAGRSLVLIEKLRENHEVYVFTFGDAYDMLFPLIPNVYKVDGLRFGEKDGKIHLIDTLRNFGNFSWISQQT